MAELAKGLADADCDPEMRSVVLTGVGEDAFCAGGVPDGFPGGSSADQLQFGSNFIGLQKQMAQLRKPLIAAVNGDAVAGGFSLLAGCDLAVASARARFGLPELHAGLYPMLALATVVHTLPRKLAFELIYQGRLLTAEEAQAYHLVNQVVDASGVLEGALDLAAGLNKLSPTAMAIGRDAYHAMVNMSPDAALNHGRYGLVALLNTRDAQEAFSARAAQRPPQWKGQ